jgi:hypothetical protein
MNYWIKRSGIVLALVIVMASPASALIIGIQWHQIQNPPTNASYSLLLLNDVASATGQGGKYLKLNSEGTAVEYGTPAGAAGITGREVVVLSTATTTVILTTLELNAAKDETKIQIFINGLNQAYTTYTISTITEINLDAPQASGSIIEIIRFD